MENSTSCIDLIFTNQPNLVIDSGVHPPLRTNCHHQILYCKLNLNIKFPPQKFNKFIVSIFSNFVPNRLVTCDDMDPPWMNEFVKTQNQIEKNPIKIMLNMGEQKMIMSNFKLQ